MPKTVAGRPKEEQKEWDKAQAKHQTWLEDEAQRAARGISTTIAWEPTEESRASGRAFLEERGIPLYEPPAPPTKVPQVDEPSLGGFIPPELERTGWYQPEKGTSYSGKPQTFEEQQFVVDYLGKYGMLPTGQQGADWKGGQDTSGFRYDPESTMGGLGFGTVGEYSQGGGRYGPLAGSDVPFNAGLVITDQQGNPTGRVDPNSPQGRQAVAEGRYINDPLSDLQGGIQVEDPSQYYRQPLAPLESLPPEETIAQFGTPEMYLEGLSDYIDDQVRLDRPKVDEAYKQLDNYEEGYTSAVEGVQSQFENGDITQEVAEGLIQQYYTQYQGLIDQTQDQIENVLMTEDRSKREFAKARDATLVGEPLENLPFFNEVSPTILARATEAQQKQYDAQKAAEPQLGTPEAEEVVKQDFLKYANGLGLSPEYHRWLLGQYGALKGLWQQSGEREFLPWLNKYLAGG